MVLGLNTECGVFGLFSPVKTNLITQMICGLNSIQHRGQESCGISFHSNEDIITYKDIGLIKNVFNKDTIINLEEKYSNINSIIGHVRYSTSGDKKFNKDYIQPITSQFKNKQKFGVSFNGNIPIIHKLYPNIEVDTYGIIELISQNNNYINDILIDFQNKIPGVFCLLVLFNNNIYILRDRYGVRPLSIGVGKGIYCVSSETNAMLEQEFYPFRDVLAGEIVKLGQNSIETIYKLNTNENMHCLFEYIYFLRPQSKSDYTLAGDFRENCGSQLAINDEEFLKNIDRSNTIVVGCPNSGICAGIAYASKADLMYKQIIEKHKNTNRTFILGNQEERIDALKNKYMFRENDIKGKVIIIVDDSVVRGNTLKILLEQLNALNPKEVHIRVASPPVISQCYYGIDIPTKEELIYNKLENENNMIKHYNVISFKYLNIEELSKFIEVNTCSSCFNGKYNKELMDW